MDFDISDSRLFFSCHQDQGPFNEYSEKEREKDKVLNLSTLFVAAS